MHVRAERGQQQQQDQQAEQAHANGAQDDNADHPLGTTQSQATPLSEMRHHNSIAEQSSGSGGSTYRPSRPTSTHQRLRERRPTHDRPRTAHRRRQVSDTHSQAKQCLTCVICHHYDICTSPTVCRQVASTADSNCDLIVWYTTSAAALHVVLVHNLHLMARLTCMLRLLFELSVCRARSGVLSFCVKIHAVTQSLMLLSARASATACRLSAQMVHLNKDRIREMSAANMDRGVSTILARGYMR